jgi:hypothetical protein
MSTALSDRFVSYILQPFLMALIFNDMKRTYGSGSSSFGHSVQIDAKMTAKIYTSTRAFGGASASGALICSIVRHSIRLIAVSHFHREVAN